MNLARVSAASLFYVRFLLPSANWSLEVMVVAVAVVGWGE